MEQLHIVRKRRSSPSSDGDDDKRSDNAPRADFRKRRRKSRGVLQDCFPRGRPFFWSVGAALLVFASLVTFVSQRDRSVGRGRLLVTEAKSSSTFLKEFHGAPSCASQLLAKEDVSFTLVTQLSDSRLWMLEHHCKRWGLEHPMSIAVLTNESALAIQQRVRDMGCGPSAVVQTMPGSMEDYPVNELRNMAISIVKTTHIVYLDVDFWPSSDLHRTLHLDAIAQHLVEDPKNALVIPAFQLERHCREYRDCRENNIPAMPNTRSKLVHLVHHHRANQFDPTNEGGHGSTDYDAWFEAEEDEIVPIDCILSNRYEPYLVVRLCDELPPFQPRFTGYGKNKMTWVMQLRRNGYRLGQISSFAIHYPHLDSPARLAWNGGKDGVQIKRPRNDYLRYRRGQTDKLFLEFRDWLGAQPDQSRFGLCEDALDDDSRLWTSHHEEEQKSNSNSSE